MAIKVYNSFKEMLDDSENYGLEMKVIVAEAFNQLFGRISLLEEDHDRLIKENKKLKKLLEKK